MKNLSLVFLLLFLAPSTFGQRFVRTVGNYAALQALNVNDPSGTNAFVNGYSTANDGGQGIWSWFGGSSTTSDGGTVLSSTSGGSGRWKRQYEGDISPMWYGSGTTIATISTLSISNALIGAAGKTLQFPPGTFRINGVLEPANNTILKGNGINTILFIDNINYGFYLTNKSGVKFDGFKFLGPSVQALRLHGGSNNVIQNCDFTGFTSLPTAGASYNTPIYLYADTGTVIQDCKFYGNGFQESHEQAYFNKTADVVAGSLGYTTGLRLLRNQIDETVVNIPFQLFDVQNLLVSGNYFNQGNFGTNGAPDPSLGYQNTGYAVTVYQSTTNPPVCQNISITGNTVTNTAGSGIYVVGARTVNIEGNNLYKVAMQMTNFGVPAAGIVVDSVNNFSVANNRIYWSSNSGLAFGAGVTNGVINGNVLTEINLHGVELRTGDGNIFDVSLTANVMSNITGNAFSINNGTNIWISGNSVNVAAMGVKAFDVTRSHIENNNFIECTSGMQILAGTQNRIKGNYLRNTSSAFKGIDYRGTNSWLEFNTIRGYATYIEDTGSGNSITTFDYVGLDGLGGFGMNIAIPLTAFHAYNANTIGTPLPYIRLDSAGVNAGNGAAIDWYIKDNAGTKTLATRIAASLQDGAIGALDADLVFYSGNNSTLTEGARLTRERYWNAGVGFTVGGLAGSGLYMRGDGTKGVFTALNGSDMTAGTVAPGRLGSGVTDATTYLAGDGTWKTYTAGLGGTVTSVALSAPSEFSVSGSPVTGAGTLTFTKANQSTNAIYVGPASGASAAPTFRSMVGADIPDALIVATTKLSATGTKNATTFLRGDNTWDIPPGGGGVGTVTSVGLALPAQFSISGSPVTTAGTLTGAWVNQVSNRFLVGPASGADAAPTFRAMIGDDIPDALIVATTKLSATGTKDSTTFLRGDNTYAVPSGGSGTFFADPTASIGLSAINGTSTNAIRSDGAPALSQAIIPTWTGLHSFISGTTNQIKVGWDVTNVGYLWGDSSGNINLNATSAEVNVAGVLDVSTGFQVGDAATSANYLRGNGTSFVSAQLSASDLATGTVPTARLGTGAAGPTTFLSGDQTWKTAVTSVGLLMPAEFTVTSSPITTSGDLNVTKASQSANTVYAAPDGAAGTPGFRLLTFADFPNGLEFTMSANGVSLSAISSTTVFTTKGGAKFFCTGFEVETTGLGSASAPTVGVYSASSAVEANKIIEQDMGSVTTIDTYQTISTAQANNSKVVPASTAVVFLVGGFAGGGGIGTPSHVANIHVRGYYR